MRSIRSPDEIADTTNAEELGSRGSHPHEWSRQTSKSPVLRPSSAAPDTIRGRHADLLARAWARADLESDPAMEAGMSRDELASKLDHLDPGATPSVPESVLAALFGDGRLSKEALAMIEAFALEHRCTFSVEHGRGTPTFEKDDIF
jgi:hypothetical protein